MTINVSCDNCARAYRIKDELAGKRFRCKDCGLPVRVPTVQEEPVEDYYSDDEWGEPEWDEAETAPSGGLPPVAGKSAPAPGRPKKPKSPRRRTSSHGDNSAWKKVGGIALTILVVLGIAARVMRVVGRAGGLPGRNAAAASYDWQDFTPLGQQFSIEMPGRPTSTSQATVAGLVRTSQFQMRSPERVFGLIYQDLHIPPGMGFDVDAGFQAGKQEMLNKIPNSRVEQETKISVVDQGGTSHPGVELHITGEVNRAEFFAIYRLFLVGSKLIITFSGCDLDQRGRYSNDMLRYLNSFKLTGAFQTLSRHVPRTRLPCEFIAAAGPAAEFPTAAIPDFNFTSSGFKSQDFRVAGVGA